MWYVFKNTIWNYFSPFGIIKNIVGTYKHNIIVEWAVVKELLKLAYKESNLMALMLKKVGVEGGVHGQLVNGMV